MKPGNLPSKVLIPRLIRQMRETVVLRVQVEAERAFFARMGETRKEANNKMNDQKRIFTSESVTEGHPDKICDQISDGVLDAILAQDPMARVACECAATTGMVLVMGEISTDCYVDIPAVARKIIERIGYTQQSGFDYKTCAILTSIDEQSSDIAMGVNSSYDDANETGAGDQGMMFGFACDETQELMPAPISMAHQLTRKLAKERKNGNLPWLRPDGKSQVSVQYDEAGEVERIDTVVVSTQHSEDIPIEEVRQQVIQAIVDLHASVSAGDLTNLEDQTMKLKSLVYKRDYTFSGTGEEAAASIQASIDAVNAQISALSSQAAQNTG